MERTSLYLVQSLPGISAGLKWRSVSGKDQSLFSSTEYLLSTVVHLESGHVFTASALDSKSLETLLVS